MDIVVHSPQLMGQGVSQHIQYSITTKTEESALDSLNSTVERRFSEFLWMREQLRLALPMVVVPALPDKQVVGRFTPDLVNSRMRGLQRFLERCAKNPSIAEHVVLHNFLSLTSDEFARFRSARNDVAAPGVTAGIMSGFSKLARMLGGGANVKRSDADISVDALQQYIASVEPVLGAMHTMLQQLQGAELATAQALSEFGSAYGMLGAAERHTLGDALQATGQCARQVATVTGSAAHSSTAILAEDMQDAQRMVQATQSLFAARKAARDAYADVLGSLQNAKTELAQAGGASGGEAGTKAALVVDTLQRQCATAEQNLHSMTLQLASSMEHFREQHLRDFLAAWARTAVSHARQAAVEAELWEGIAETAQKAATVEASAAPHLSSPAPAAPTAEETAGDGSAAAGAEQSPDRDAASATPATPQEHAFSPEATPEGGEQGEFL